MSKKLSDLATVAEILSAIAIVASLIFVGIQVHENTVNETLSSYDRVNADLIDWQMQLVTNPETLAAVNTFLMGEERGDEPMKMGQGAVVALWRIYERAYFARAYGRLGDQEWGRYQRFICQPLMRETLVKLSSQSFTDEFWRFAQNCEPG